MNRGQQKSVEDCELLGPSIDFDVQSRSGRILSCSGDPLIRVDVSRQCDRTEVWERDLSDVTLSMWGSRAHASTTIPILSVRYAACWAHIAIDAELDRMKVSTRVGHRVSSAFNAFHRFCIWMARRGIVDLSTIARNDTDALLEDLSASASWAPLLGELRAYEALLERVRNSEDPMEAVRGFVSFRRTGFTLSEAKLTSLLGLPVHNQQVPVEFGSAIAALVGVRRLAKAESRTDKGMAKRTLRGILTCINDLARIGDQSDGRFGLGFVPYSNPVRVAAQVIKRPADSFDNMSLENVVALIRECRTWIDQYAEGIIKFYQELAAKLAELKDRYASSGAASHALSLYVREVSPRYEKEFGLPAITFPWWADGSARSMSDLVRTLQAACAVIVLVNHGRRNNEVVGEGSLPYGMYQGCLTTHDQGEIKRYELRVYIEKTVRNWASMSANAGVARAVHVLEALLDAGCRVVDEFDCGVELRRTDEGELKLFQVVPLAFGRKIAPAPMLIWHDHVQWLFERAGIDPSRSKSQAHPFRRVFAQIYYYRFENADIRALSQWLGHASISSSLIYVTDPAARANAERIEAKHRQVNDMTLADLRAFGREYLNDCLLRLLDGRPSGGGFTALALRVFRAMSGRASFPTDTPERAKAMSAWFTERGYEPEPHPHGACLAGTNALSKARSKCYDTASKQLKKYQASPVKCSGCPHAYVNDGYIESDREELARFQHMSSDEALPSLLRNEAAKAAADMQTVIEIELKLEGANRERMRVIYDEIARHTENRDD